MAKDDKELLITLRGKILIALDTLAMTEEHEWVSSDMVAHLLKLKYKEVNSLSRVGNNLRILREAGVVEDRIARGTRYWKKTGRAYSPEVFIKRLVAFPKNIDNQIILLSEKAGVSKNAFIVNLVATGINSLSPLDGEHLKSVLRESASAP